MGEKLQKLSMKTKVIYGSGNFAANLMNNTVGAYVSYYYTQVAGLPIAAVGVILLLCRLVDAVSDLAMGVIVENTHTKQGKARPWVKRMAIPFGIAVFLMFFSPNWGMAGKIIWAGATYCAGISIVYTAISVPYNTMSALITNDQNDRTQLATMRQLFGFLGPLFVSGCTIPLVNLLGGNQSAWSIVAGAYGIIGAIIYFAVYFSTKELDIEETGGTKEEKPKFSLSDTLRSLKALLKNHYWVIVLCIQLLIFISYGISSVQTYYCLYILGNDNLTSILSIASQIPNIALCAVIPALANKFGKRNVSMVGCIIAIIGTALMWVNSTSVPLLVAAIFLKTAGLAPICILVFAMVGDTALYGEWKFGVKNEGLIFSAITFGEKVGNALGGALISFLMAATGFVEGAATQSAMALFGMKLGMIAGPMLIAAGVFILLIFYKLDGIYPTVLKELEERKQAEA